MSGWLPRGVSDTAVTPVLLVLGGAAVGFGYGVVQAFAERNELPGAEAPIAVAIYVFMGCGFALKPDAGIRDRIHMAVLIGVMTLYGVLGGTYLPYALGIDGRSLEEFGLEVNDDMGWPVLVLAFVSFTVIGSLVGVLVGLLSHGAAVVLRRIVSSSG